MQNNLQKASFWKRIAAWMFDGIVVATICVGVAFLLSYIFSYDSYINTVTNAYEKYEVEFSVDFDISAEEYEKLSSDEIEKYNKAYDALNADEDAIYAYNMTVNLSLIIATLALLVGVMLWEFVIPLILGNGQTLGKKIFGLFLVRPNCVKISRFQLFVRALLGKFTVETMIPAYIILMLIWGTLNFFGLLIFAILFVVQAVLLIVNENRSLLHDIIAVTVVADATSTRTFENEDELIEYKKARHAEEVSKKAY